MSGHGICCTVKWTLLIQRSNSWNEVGISYEHLCNRLYDRVRTLDIRCVRMPPWRGYSLAGIIESAKLGLERVLGRWCVIIRSPILTARSAMQVYDDLQTILCSPFDCLLKVRQLSLNIWLIRTNVERPVTDWQAHMVEPGLALEIRSTDYLSNANHAPSSSDLLKIIFRIERVPMLLESCLGHI